MGESVWSVIKKSKGQSFLSVLVNPESYVNSTEQYINLENILKKMDKETVQRIYDEWSDKVSELTNDKEFMKLHWSQGGIVNSGDDGFFMDFGNWVIAQGESLYNDFKKKGHKAVIDYVKKHNIDEADYTYECMIYAFHDFVE